MCPSQYLICKCFINLSIKYWWHGASATSSPQFRIQMPIFGKHDVRGRPTDSHIDSYFPGRCRHFILGWIVWGPNTIRFERHALTIKTTVHKKKITPKKHGRRGNESERERASKQTNAPKNTTILLIGCQNKIYNYFWPRISSIALHHRL